MKKNSERGYLLDTNVISESAKRVPAPEVLSFLESTSDEKKFLSVLTIGELRFGAYRLRVRDAERAVKLTQWIEHTENTFKSRVLSIDLRIVDVWAQFCVKRDKPHVDTLIAATASIHGLTLVTRNIRDIEGLPVDVLNPWAV